MCYNYYLYYILHAEKICTINYCFLTPNDGKNMIKLNSLLANKWHIIYSYWFTNDARYNESKMMLELQRSGPAYLWIRTIRQHAVTDSQQHTIQKCCMHDPYTHCHNSHVLQSWVVNFLQFLHVEQLWCYHPLSNSACECGVWRRDNGLPPNVLLVSRGREPELEGDTILWRENEQPEHYQPI